jgi:phosphomannomutase
MSEDLQIRDLMERCGVKFGTSGARGLASAMTDEVCYAYTAGFLSFLEESHELKRAGESVAIAGDLRPSTGRIMAAVAQAVRDMGYVPVNCGRIPSPAVALLGFEKGIPSIMVTGSHIPADRNGIKFNKCSGEILKRDEERMMAQHVLYRSDLVVESLPAEDDTAVSLYLERYTKVFPADCLANVRVGVYQHSAVGREVLVELFSRLGADVIPLGFSDTFVPVDTEAIRANDVALALAWSKEFDLDCIVSTDGDSDRPLISDEQGSWLRGDVAGILVARFLGAASVHTPVSCNTAVEACGWFKRVERTKIGSPYVVDSMQEAAASGDVGVVGYEANGGFLTQSSFRVFEGELGALPTRDAILPMLAVMLYAKTNQISISACVKQLPQRYTASDRIENFPSYESSKILNLLLDKAAVEEMFGSLFGEVDQLDRTDGLRITFDSGEVLHLRPSGNAPEFRCYNEADSIERVREMQQQSMERLLVLKD